MTRSELPGTNPADSRTESGDEDHENEDAANAPEAVVAMDATDVQVGIDKGGAQVWSENCMRCHNLRRPRQRSDREWEAIVHHMRVRANLTSEEHRLIVRFLQAAN